MPTGCSVKNLNCSHKKSYRIPLIKKNSMRVYLSSFHRLRLWFAILKTAFSFYANRLSVIVCSAHFQLQESPNNAINEDDPNYLPSLHLGPYAKSYTEIMEKNGPAFDIVMKRLRFGPPLRFPNGIKNINQLKRAYGKFLKFTEIYDNEIGGNIYILFDNLNMTSNAIVSNILIF